MHIFHSLLVRAIALVGIQKYNTNRSNTLGQRFALEEEKIVMCHLLRQFTFEATQEPTEMDEVTALVLRPMNGVILKVKHRF